MCVAIRSRNHRSWLMTTAHPAKLMSASSSARRVSTSQVVRRLVEQQQVAAAAEAASPGGCDCAPRRSNCPRASADPGPLKLNLAAVRRELATLQLAQHDVVRPAASLPGTRCSSGFSAFPALVHVRDLHGRADGELAPRPASPTPRSCLKSVVLPAPFGPMTPTMPPLGRLNVQVSRTAGCRRTPSRCPRPEPRGRPAAGRSGIWISQVLLAASLVNSWACSLVDGRQAGLALGHAGAGRAASPIPARGPGCFCLALSCFSSTARRRRF